MEKLVKLVIKGISYSQTQTGAYALILEEELGNRKLPVIIGSFEAQSIALALENDITPPRPLTHDLFLTLSKEYSIEIEMVYIYKLEDGVFYSNIVFTDENNKKVQIDSRTSDAIALAVRFDAPIYAYKEVLEKAGINLEFVEQEDDETEVEVFEEEDFLPEKSSKSREELEEEMKNAVMNEDYELAARIRDQIEKLKN